MELDSFWKLIERTHREAEGVPSRQFDLLVQALVELSAQEIIAFDRIFNTLMIRAYTSDVWNAAYVMTSCGDDSFTDFRGWLIAQGKTIYENALRDPDTLADVVAVEASNQCCWESLSYASDRAYWQKTNEEDGIPGYGFAPALTGNVPLIDPGETYKEHYPKLWAKFGWMWKESNEDKPVQSDE